MFGTEAFTCDWAYIHQNFSSNELVHGTRTNICKYSCNLRPTSALFISTGRSDTIGEGAIQFVGDGRDFIAYNGQIVVDESVKVGGFKAGGLFVKVLALSMLDHFT